MTPLFLCKNTNRRKPLHRNDLGRRGHAAAPNSFYTNNLGLFGFFSYFEWRLPLDFDDMYCIMVAQERMAFLLWSLYQKRSPMSGDGRDDPRYSGSIPVFPAFLFSTLKGKNMLCDLIQLMTDLLSVSLALCILIGVSKFWTLVGKVCIIIPIVLLLTV